MTGGNSRRDAHRKRPALRPGLGAIPAGLRALGATVTLALGATVTLALGATIALALGATIALWAALTGAGPAQLDGAMLAGATEARFDGLTAVAVVVTDVGSTMAMTALAVAVGIWLGILGRRADAALVLGAMAGAGVAFGGLKVLLDRPRPPTVDRLVDVTTESLPSGHATMSVAVVGSLLVLAWAGRGTAARAAMVAAAALWVGAVGATRVYLGVHWFSDVVAGWLVGAAWLATCVAVWSWWRSGPTSPVP